MKRIFIIISVLAAALSTSSCGVIRLALDTRDSNGVRTVATSNAHLMGNMKGQMDIALAARVEKKDTIMAVILTINADSGHGLFNKGDKMKIRLDDDSVIDLVNLYDKEYEEKEETYVTDSPRTQIRYAYSYDYFYDDFFVSPYMVNQMVPEVRHTKNSYSYALYLITKPQINDIIKKGVKKLRVEIENDDLDMPDPTTVPGTFQALYNVIKGSLANDFKRSEF